MLALVNLAEICCHELPHAIQRLVHHCRHTRRQQQQIFLVSSTAVALANHQKDPCAGFWKCQVYLTQLTHARWMSEVIVSCQQVISFVREKVRVLGALQCLK